MFRVVKKQNCLDRPYPLGYPHRLAMVAKYCDNFLSRICSCDWDGDIHGVLNSL